MTWSRTLIVVLLNVTIKLVLACPTDVCTCKWKGGKQTVECGSGMLENIPSGMDPGTQVLNFSGNSLQILKSDRFYEMNLINLQKIYLCRNQLIRIHDKAFRGLSNLVELDLSENMLTTVPTETFQDYTSLMRLSLSGNPIRELKTNAFRYLSFLTTLELSNCQIEKIEDEAFIGMDNVEWLRLDGNRLGTIKGNHILPKSLHGINLYNNRWNCDCHLLDLHAWLVNYNIPQQNEDPKCTHPVRLNGQVIKFLKTDELACLPDITPTTLYLELSEGRNISLLCKISAIPEASISWWFQGQILQNDTFVSPNLHLYYYIEEGVQEKRSELFIFNTKTENSGTFSCVAENLAGRAQTNYTIRVIVKGEPIPEPISFSYKYFLATIIGAGLMGFMIVLLLCCLLLRCMTKSRRDSKGRKSSKDSITQFQNSKNSSVIGERNAQIPMTKSNGNLSVTQQDMVMLLNQNPIGEKTAASAAANKYCSPLSARNFYERNPDLINDAESVKSRMKNDGDDTGSGSVSLQESLPSLPSYGTTTCLRGQSFMQQNVRDNVPKINTLGTLPRGIIKDSYHHQVDVHLNPGCFLEHDGFPVTYRMHGIPVLPHVIQKPDANKMNIYRTLPHKSKLQSAQDKSGFTMETQFLAQNPPNPYDMYSFTNLRYTAEGYPRQPKQVAFADQQFPSPPEGYKQTHSSISPIPPHSISTPPPTCSSPALQQWPPCLPGYHHTSTQVVPIRIQTNDNVQQYPPPPPTATKRCIGAQTSSDLKSPPIPSTTHQQHDEEEEEEEDEAKGNNENVKRLVGPLADSPDEGYVGDSQDGLDI